MTGARGLLGAALLVAASRGEPALEAWFDTTPTFFHSCRLDGGLREKDLDWYVQGHHMSTLCKGENLYPEETGPDAPKAEESMVATCERIKARWPDMPCFVYSNSLLSWRYFNMAREYEWLLKAEEDVTPWKMSGDRTFPDWQDLLVFDFRSEVVAKWWTRKVGCMVRSNKKAVDGVFVDRSYLDRDKEGSSVRANGQSLFPRHFDSYTNGKNDALNMMVDDGVQLIVNPGTYFYRDNRSPEGHRFTRWLQKPQFIQLEYFCREAWSIYKLREALLAGKNVQARGGMTQCPRAAKTQCSSEMRGSLATFLHGIEEPSEADGIGRAYFNCFEFWFLDLDEKRRKEQLGFEEFALPLGRPGPRVSPDDLGEQVEVLHPDQPGGRNYNAYRPFYNRDTQELQAVAVWTSRLQTVCFVHDCVPNDDVARGRKRCLGNPGACEGILALFS